MTNTDQQKLDALQTGTGQAFYDWIARERDVSTLYAIQDGVKNALEAWLDVHTDQIIEAIVQNASERLTRVKADELRD
jgi:hypothetical protein